MATSELLELNYVVLELPWNILLVYNRAFSNISDAEDLLDTLPNFSIWTSKKIESWSGRVIYIPLRQTQATNTYTLQVFAKISVAANSPEEAHRKARNLLTGSTSLRTRIIGLGKSVINKGEQKDGRTTVVHTPDKQKRKGSASKIK